MDILGFTAQGVKEYFQAFFKEEQQAEKMFGFVMANETLYTACFIPVICWIVCTVFRNKVKNKDIKQKDMNDLETTTSIFMHFVLILLKHHFQSLSRPETLLKSLGKLAEKGFQEHRFLFDEKS